MTKEELNVEAEFEEIENNEENNVTIERGVVVFQDSEGNARHQLIGEMSLADLTFFNRYLGKLEEAEWNNIIQPGLHIPKREDEENA